MADHGKFPQELLTAREREIVALIAEGLTNQQIADQLYLTFNTVKWYNRQIYQKLGVRSRTQAIAAVRDLENWDTTTPSVKHNLPEHGTYFVGREQELADIQSRLANPACRLLTLVGPGGIGKTRLAIEAARRQAMLHPDGVYMVEFASVESPTFVMQAIADGLGLALTNQRSVQEQVISYLREKSLLLLLDNFEHLLESVDLIGELLARTKAPKILVTSRERLQLKEEWLFDVEGLHYPQVETEGQQQSNLAEFEAGQLFLATAQRAKAEFVPEGDDPAQIARICRLVGGMPLAIELAATWVRLLPSVEIARGIAHDLEMLSTSWRDVPERHRSIQAVLDHSWNLLSPNEQDVFRRLTVFSGAFRREAAVAVTDTSLTELLALVDKSFLRRTDSGRFGVHELVKQYGRNKLQAEPKLWAKTRLRHCRYFSALFVTHVSAHDIGPHLGEIESVFDDLQIAWRYAVENCQVDQLRHLAEGFLKHYHMHSWYRAGSSALELYRQALACFDTDMRNPDHRATLAYLHESIGELLELTTAFQKALETTADDDYIQRGRLYGKVADAWLGMNQHELAHETYALAESVLENALQLDETWWHEWLHIQTQRMELYYWQNRPADMTELASRIGPLFEQHGSVTQRLRYLYTLYLMALRRDRFFYSSDAIAYSAEALSLSLETGNLREVAYRYFTYGFSCLWSDRFDEAETHLQIARRMMEQNGDLKLLARALTYLTLTYRRRDDIERVREFAALSLGVAGEANLPQFTGSARAHYAWLAWRAGDLAETKRRAQAAIEDWGGLVEHQAAAPYRWYALFPLMGVVLQEANIEDAVQCARCTIAPSQVRLPDEMTTSLKRAVAAGENGQRDAASGLLHHALHIARELHYI